MCIQLFRETFSEEVHATIPKDIIVGCFEFYSSEEFERIHERPWTYVCESVTESNKSRFDSWL